MKRRSGFRCFECDDPAHHAHHIIPHSLGGTRTIPLCHSCHSKAHGGLGFSHHSELVKAGMQKAKSQGTHIGRPRKHVPMKIVKDLRASGHTYKEIAGLFNLTTDTLRRIVRENT